VTDDIRPTAWPIEYAEMNEKIETNTSFGVSRLLTVSKIAIKNTCSAIRETPTSNSNPGNK
jgi:hypothetical protein